jgi:alpha-galactosidase
MTVPRAELLNFRGGESSIVIDLSGPTPIVLHWGADLGANVDRSQFPSDAVPHSSYDTPHVEELVPQASSGWRGRPALEGHRAGGLSFSPALATSAVSALEPNGCAITLEDSIQQLQLTVELTMSEHGMLRVRSSLRNTGSSTYFLQGLSTTLPVGAAAAEVLDLSGRWCREQHPQRQSLRQGTWMREYRHGRTGHDSSVLTAVGATGFGNRSRAVWATHFGFSGNHATFVERAAIGSTRIGNTELLAPGEIELAPGADYATPWTYAAYSAAGLDGITRTFHSYLRSRATHPASPRPVVLNTWEAVYFSHELDNLLDLADSASAVGVERFVLDDGWFRHRRNDSAGLGDWYVDEEIWPDGLTRLIDGVRSRGMEFGLWVEPEMVNEDSDVIRAHPEWISGPGSGRTPPEWRNQQVIDLTNPDAWAYVYERIDALLSENAISYLKWDQNRDLTEMGHDGAPSTHAQTLAAYRLFDELRAAHPGVEIESCSSGGARVDLGILERTDRVWASDCNDALERQTIQRWTGAVLPPELVGSHVGPTRAHTTHRSHSLSFRAITAMFGHFGIEWDIRTAGPADIAELACAVDLYKTHRTLIHTGVAVHAELADPAYSLYGSVAQDGSEALFAFVSVATSTFETPGRIGFPGLNPSASYEVTVVFPSGDEDFMERAAVGWIASGVTATGVVLAEVGLPMPILAPEHAILIRVVRKIA